MSWRRRHWVLAGAAAAGAVALTAGFVVTHDPAPGALVIRATLDGQAADLKKKLAAHDPDGVVEQLDLAYGARAANRLDVYRPAGARGELPAVVWLHGGGWVAGDKADWATYYRLLANAGFAVVAVNYSRAPESAYPVPVREANAALGYVRRHARRLGADPGRLVLAGDSAGAQLAAQVAALTTNPSYARGLRIAPAVPASVLRGTVLDCGAYDLMPYVRGDDHPDRILDFAVSQLLWAYTGTNDPASPVFPQMSVIDHVTSAFPPSFITGGNADPLTDRHSRPMAQRLRELGVAVDALLYPADHEPRLGHEYQLDLDTDAGQTALARTIAFLHDATAPQ